MSQTVETKREACPSHGRGRRFNPYSAHHFTGAFRSRPGTTRQNTARTGKFSRAKSVHIVHGAFVSFGAHILTATTNRHRRAAKLVPGSLHDHRPPTCSLESFVMTVVQVLTR